MRISLLLFLFFFFPKFAFAQDASPAGDIVPTTAQVSADYPLPYPGMLPDNPLYIIKTVRDGIILFLISDPIKKAEFNLLQAGKRFQAGLFLIKKSDQKAPLAFSTIDKGINYFSQSITIVAALKKEGMDTAPLVRKLSASFFQYTFMLSDMAKSYPQEKKTIDILKAKLLPFEHKLFLLSR